jgi:hypothetical protein
MALLFTPEENRCLNFYKVNLGLIAFSNLLPFKVAGFTLVGYSWVIFLLFSLFTLLRNQKVHFPLLFYLPWSLYIIGYIIFDFSFFGLQSTLQYLCPLIAGMAASGFEYNERILARLIYYLKVMAWFSFLIGILLPQVNLGFIRYYTGPAALVMTTTLIMTVLVAEFFIYKKFWNIVYFGILFLIPYVGITRMAILMSLTILPLHMAPVRVERRLLITAVMVIAGVLVFYSPMVQQKMFFSGKGTLSDLAWNNSDFYSGGRTFLYQTLEQGIKEQPVWGMGPRSDMSALQGAGLKIIEVHNDYLSVRYNYGWVGIALLFISFLFQVIDLFRLNNKRWPPMMKVYTSSALTLFIPMFGFMYTDNILKYTIFFGTLHFAMIGIIYSVASSVKVKP